MLPNRETPTIDDASDAELVAACLAGSREAYGRIVGRYQRLLCSLAYSAVGSVSESEDIAQEAFIEGWRELASLREPQKLRAWMCGILRHKVSRRRRRDGREPSARAESLEAANAYASEEEPASQSAMKNEEQAILWSELERVPELYREPLVLYYREHRSVEHVAAALDLTEDAVKQRLARGRKILQERVLSFVETALSRSTPGRVFTAGVLASLPAMIPGTAKAAGIGAAAAAHGSVMAKTTSLAALLASVTGVATTILALRANLDQSRTPRERRAVVWATILCFFGSLAVLGIFYGLRESALTWWESRYVFAAICQFFVVSFMVAWPCCIVWMMRRMRTMRTEERQLHPECFSNPIDHRGSAASELRSRIKLLGVPLFHFQFSSPEVGDKPIIAWIAAGDRAIGLLFAWGGYAIAPISVGAVSVGILSVGAMSVGVISLGTFCIGAVALGCVTIGLKAYAWLSALGWHSAQSGGFSIARLAAEGPIAIAEHANSPTARQLLADPSAEQNQMIFYILIVVLSLIPIAYYASAVRKRLGPAARGGKA